MGHPRPLEVIHLVILLGEFMEDGKVVLLEEVIKKATRNLTGILVRL